MKNKKKLLITLGAILMVVAIVCVILFKGNLIATAGYSSAYTKTFGKFTAKTTNLLIEGKNENTCYSPVSLFAALSLAAETTEGEARQQIIEALGVSSIEELEEIYSQMLKDVEVEPVAKSEIKEETASESEEDMPDRETTKQKPTAVPKSVKMPSQITLCNSLWIEKSHKIEGADEVIDNCMDKLNCEIFECEKIEVSDVNSWVSDKTNGLIPEMLKPSQYSLVLANALYYKANWKYSFNELVDRDFFLENGETESVPYIICEEEKMYFKETNDYTAVSVPMEEGEMMFVLPDKNIKLEKLLSENKLNEILAMSTNGQMHNGLVTITLPKYECKYDFGTEIVKTVEEIGIERLFEGDQWSVVSEASSQKVDISQKTNIIVNEDGIEAAAATYVSADYLSAIEEIEPELVITLDRPFLYVLMKDGVPLFIGTVYNPA